MQPGPGVFKKGMSDIAAREVQALANTMSKGAALT